MEKKLGSTAKTVYVLEGKPLENADIGIKTAIDEFLSKGSPGLRVLSKRIYDSYKNTLQDLRVLAHMRECKEDTFTKLAENKISKNILKGIYRYFTKHLTNGELGEVKKSIDNKKNRVETIKNEREKIAETLSVKIEKSESERGLKSLNGLQKILKELDTTHRYCKYLVIKFTKKILTWFDDKVLSRDENLKTEWRTKISSANDYRNKRKKIKNLGLDCLKWIEKDRDEIKNDFSAKFKNIMADLSISTPISFSNIENLEWHECNTRIENLTDSIRNLVILDNKLVKARKIAGEIEELLGN